MLQGFPDAYFRSADRSHGALIEYRPEVRRCNEHHPDIGAQKISQIIAVRPKINGFNFAEFYTEIHREHFIGISAGYAWARPGMARRSFFR
jgi:hypothetical protein